MTDDYNRPPSMGRKQWRAHVLETLAAADIALISNHEMRLLVRGYQE